MDAHFKLEKKSFSLIGFLLALLAFLLVLCWMNEFGHKNPASQTSKEREARTVVDSPSETDLKVTPELLSENTANGICMLEDLNLNGDDLKAISAIKNLHGLKLHNCKFRGPFFPTQPNSAFETVSISNSELDGQLLENLSQVSSLKCLNIFTCALAPHALDSLGTTRLVWLQLRNSRELSGDNSFTAADLASVAKIPSLKHLELEHSEIQANAVGSLKLSGAEVVNLNHCDLCDADLLELASMRNLKFLDISYNPKITDKGITYLLGSPSIKQIKYDVDLSDGHLTKINKDKLNQALYKVPRSFYQM